MFADVSDLSGVGEIVYKVLIGFGVFYAVLRKEFRKDTVADDARDKSLAGEIRKIHNQSLERHAEDYARWNEERDNWRDQMTQMQGRLENVERENRELKLKNRELELEAKSCRDEQARILHALKARGLNIDTAILEVPKELR